MCVRVCVCVCVIQRSIIRPGLIGLQTKIIGVLTIRLPAVITLRFSVIACVCVLCECVHLCLPTCVVPLFGAAIAYTDHTYSDRVCVITKESELHHSIGSLIDGAHPGPKTDRDYLGRYCP